MRKVTKQGQIIGPKMSYGLTKLGMVVLNVVHG